MSGKTSYSWAFSIGGVDRANGKTFSELVRQLYSAVKKQIILEF